MLKEYIGRTIYGYCNGYFGRDSYEDKTIVYIGRNYIVVEHNDDNKTPGMAYFYRETIEQIIELLEEWSVPIEH